MTFLLLKVTKGLKHDCHPNEDGIV